MTALAPAVLQLLLLWTALLSWSAAEPSRRLATPGVERLSSSLVPPDVQTADHVDRLAEVFHAARAERQRHDYARASELYGVVVAQCGNATSRHRQLRMWTQYQHAHLLMRYVAPNEPNSAARARIQRQAIAKFHEAVALSETVQFSETSLRFRAAERVHAFNSMGLLARALNEPQDAIAFFQSAIAADASAHQPLANLAVVLLSLGDIERALEVNTRALARKPDDMVLVHNMGTIFYGRGDEARAQWWWERTLAIDPLATEAMASLASVHGAQGDAEKAQHLLSRAVELALPGPTRQSYRLQLALSHLAMLYDATEQLERARFQFEAALQVLHREAAALPDPMDTVGAGSMGYYAIYQGHDDKRVRQLLARVYFHGARETLDFVAPHVEATGHQQQLQRRRIRVGFLSGFLYDHSVGLLLSGVIRRLPRDEFEVFVITFDGAQRDHVTRQLEAATEPRHWVKLPQRDLQRAQQRVAALELDILVFGEIGMHAETYFLAFARLARRTVQFWGHAITSGIATVDYFVSSTLFRRDVGRSDQAKYTECLYEMDGLTTLFPRPVAPQTGLTRAALGLPSETTMPHLVLVPQTLYKLHPDFDRILQRVLSRDAGSFLVLPVGHTPRLMEQLTRRWRRGGVVDASVYKRTFFVRQLDRGEFLALCAMATLVLDPFPVGGGRSSLEVFSVGTPILALASRTTILQLTLGMYRRMGIDPSCCVFDREDALANAALALLGDRRKREKLRDQILRRNHRLYEADNARVVREWQRMFTRILKHDEPAPTRFRDAADAKPKQCPQWNDSDQNDAFPPQIVYESTVTSAERSTQVVRLYDHDDPLEVAAALAQGDMLQAAFLGKVLWNAQQRARNGVVAAFHVQPDASAPKCAIEIREGDDLYQVVRWQLQQQLPRGTALDALVAHALNEAARRVPQHTSAAWREARALVPSRSFPPAVLASQQRRDCVALVVTTCRRLALFIRTMRSLAAALGISSHAQWFGHFCAVLVVDDSSSPSDRRAMRDAFPRFSFLLKTPRQRGHAASLNLALRALKWARFMLYVEDDWAFRASAGNTSFVEDAVAVLRPTPLVQVLLNDQHSGYYTTTLAQTNVSYAVHEFAVLDAAQRFAYWPGFSLNPGVWDLAKLSLVLGDHRHALFEEDSDLFERAFALRVWRAGLHVGYLRRGTVCDHIGVAPHASAYVLNGLPRRFD